MPAGRAHKLQALVEAVRGRRTEHRLGELGHVALLGLPQRRAVRRGVEREAHLRESENADQC